ncbi:MAG: hypothetical protein V4671_06580 [Armatimonadota bacterium]
MSAVQKLFLTPEQYLEQERAAEFRSEYIFGEVFAMAGASREDNLISLNIGRRLSEQQAYVLVAQNTARIERFVRQGDFWLLADSAGLEASVSLETIGCTLELSNIFRKVTFPQ